MSLEPLFNSNALLDGWFDDNRHIYNTEMKWIAFIQKGNVFSSATSRWLGPIHGFNCLDRKGRVVAWNPKQLVQGTLVPTAPLSPSIPLTPTAPLMPMRPLAPLTPLTPAGGWSALDFNQWALQ